MLGLYNPFPNIVPKNKVSHRLHFYFFSLLIQSSLASELYLIIRWCHSETVAVMMSTPHTSLQNPRGMCNLPEHRWVLLPPLHSHGGCLYLLTPEANQPRLWTHVKNVKDITYILKPYWHFTKTFGSLPFPSQLLHHCLPLTHSGFITSLQQGSTHTGCSINGVNWLSLSYVAFLATYSIGSLYFLKFQNFKYDHLGGCFSSEKHPEPKLII